MNKEELKRLIIEAVSEYLENEEGYGDCAQLEIDPKTLAVEIVSVDEDSDDKDYYMLMDMVKGSDAEPGIFIPDEDTIEEITEEYLN